MGVPYNSSNQTVFNSYLNFYPDISNNYNSWLGDQSNIHWADYVRANSDLENVWLTTVAATGKTRWDWGFEHYQTYGKNESRTIPKVIATPNPADRSTYVTITIDQIGAPYYSPAIPSSNSNATASFGQFHWDSAGNKEDRILPGVIKITADANGNLAVNYDAMGTGGNIQKVYEYAIQRFKDAQAGGQPGTYLSALGDLQKNIPEFYNDLVNSGAKGSLDAYYTKQKISPWDAVSQGAQPPTGGFDPLYYRTQTGIIGSEADAAFNNALAQGDLDIIGRFTRDTYAQYHYTTTGKTQGARGNAAEDAAFAKQYAEYLTDADYQAYRDQVLGLTPEGGTGTTLLEGELSSVIGAKEAEQQKMFSALTIDSLRQSIAELQKAKQQESEYAFFNQFSQIGEITSINESIANSLLGDTGVGGLLGWSGDPNKIQEQFESTVSQVTGIPSRSNVIYNWQKWFDEQLVGRYKDGATFTDPDDPTKTYTIDAAFATDYIDRYLKPRFDTSRSMTEFISYMDVKQNEQNIFQTQSAWDSLRTIADLRAKAYLDQIRQVSNPTLGGTASVFDPDFYFNPTGNFAADDPKLARYAEQKARVAADYEIAKTQGATAKVPGTTWTWNQWAYYYGLNPNDPQQFAKLHYQVYGAANGYDPAKDLITLKSAEEYIKTSILPSLEAEKAALGDVAFLNFVTPEEFADALIEGIDPAVNKEEWDKLLESLGLSNQQMGLDELKKYIVEAFQTDAAKTIREGIKYLNEKKLTPTQERLGVEYIQRPEDAKTATGTETQLYTIFKNAGYQGNEDEFYEKFMPDVDRSEMELLTQGQTGLQLSDSFKGLTSEDPFEAVFSMEKLFADETPTKTTTSSDEEAPSYFRLFEDDTDTDYKSETGTKILGEFTSFLKGFS